MIASIQLWFWLIFAAAYHLSDLYLPASSPMALIAHAHLPALPLSLFFPTWVASAALLMLGDWIMNRLRKLLSLRILFSRDLVEALETGAAIAGVTSLLYAQCDPNSNAAFSYSSFELSAGSAAELEGGIICSWLEVC